MTPEQKFDAAATKQAQERFAAATRNNAYHMSLSIREIRRLKWTGSGPPDFDSDIEALEKLISKGLAMYNHSGGVVLTEMGVHQRRMLVLSGHIVEDPTPQAPVIGVSQIHVQQ